MYTKEIIVALHDTFSNHICFSEVKNGSTWGGNHRRMDFLAIKPTWSPVTIKAFEVKVSRSDFLGDTKWVEYLDLCNQFYWVCPKGLIKRNEIDPKVGLVYVNPDSMKASVVKAAIYRDVPPDPMMLLYLILWRDKQYTKPTLERIKEDMREKREIGKQYGQFVSKRLNEADNAVRAAWNGVEEAATIPPRAQAVITWMEKNDVWAFTVPRVLDAALAILNITDIKKTVHSAVQSLAIIDKYFQGEE